METQRDGKNPETAFLITDSSGEFSPEIISVLNNLFGTKDGNYFIHSETTLNQKNKKYKVLYVEDAKKLKHTIYFELG